MLEKYCILANTINNVKIPANFSNIHLWRMRGLRNNLFHYFEGFTLRTKQICVSVHLNIFLFYKLFLVFNAVTQLCLHSLSLEPIHVVNIKNYQDI